MASSEPTVRPVKLLRRRKQPAAPIASGAPAALAGCFGRFDHTQYVSMTMEFRCNLKCVHCMIEGTMERLAPQTFDQFKELLEHNARTQQWKGLTLPGSKTPLHRALPLWARMARDNGFDHVRIQTHGMKL